MNLNKPWPPQMTSLLAFFLEIFKFCPVFYVIRFGVQRFDTVELFEWLGKGIFVPLMSVAISYVSSNLLPL